MAEVDLSGLTPVLYARVSDSTQADALPGQVVDLQSWASRGGFPRPAKTFSEVASGAKSDRKQFAALMKYLQARKDPSKFIVLIRDPQRWARDTKTALIRIDELNAMGVNLLITDLNYLIGPDAPDEEALTNRMVFTILAAVSEGGKASEYQARAKGVVRATARGVFEGKVKNLYPAMKRNPFQRVADALPALNSKSISQKGFNREIGFGENTKWLRDQIKVMNQITEKGGPELLADWLEVISELRALEKKRGIGRRDAKASQKSRKAKALHRVTVAYLREPWNWPNPIREGNPAAASGDFIGAGTISDAVENFQKYQPKK
jgi:DNA invertase Pin-like site-specific DNA recombinase